MPQSREIPNNMKTVIINGQSHHGSTYHIAHMLGTKIGGELTELFLPKDLGEFCVGCTRCFLEGEDKCPHYSKVSQITKYIDEADVIILASPVYVYHVTGAMKAMLDHYGYRWMAHRPEKAMFKKQGVCIATASGAGVGSANKDMADSLFNWGVGKIYKLGMPVAAANWDQVSDKKKRSLENSTDRIAQSIKRSCGKVTPSLKTKAMFMLMRMMQKNGWNEHDKEYWEKNGWLGNGRPWK